MKLSPEAPSAARGIALGLWTLCGLAFLLGALLPGSAGEGALGPLLLALAAGWTALLPHREQSAPRPTPDNAPRSLRGLLLAISGALFVAGTSLTIIREGDIRSFLFVAAVVALVLTLGRSETGLWYTSHGTRPPPTAPHTPKP